MDDQANMQNTGLLRHYDAPEPQVHSTLEVAPVDSQEQKEVVRSENGTDLPQALHPNAMPQSQYVPFGYQSYYDPRYTESLQSPYYQPSQDGTQYSQLRGSSPTLSAAAFDKGANEGKPEEKKQQRVCGLVPKTFWILAALVIVGIIAAVVGGVLGVVLSKKNSTEGEAPGPKNSTDATNSTTHSILLESSQLAAVNWTDKDHYTHYAVFAQDSSNALMVSLWDSKSQAWSAVNVSKAIAASGHPITLKPGTPITAVATGPPKYDFEMQVAFVTPNNMITMIKSSDMSGLSWALGDLMATSPKIADTNSSLASVWHRCDNGPACTGDIILAYQTGGDLMLLNSSDWSTPKQPGGRVTPVAASPINLIMVGGSQLRMYFQDSVHVILELKGEIDGSWAYGYLPGGYTQTPSNIQFAGAAYDNYNRTFVATANKGGLLTGYIWDSQTWIPNQPLALSDVPNSTNQTFTSIAQHSEQRLYALAGDSIQEYRWGMPDPRTLTYVGNVAIKPTN